MVAVNNRDLTVQKYYGYKERRRDLSVFGVDLV